MISASMAEPSRSRVLAHLAQELIALDQRWTCTVIDLREFNERLADRTYTISTDNLARHPGRPWKLEPEQVPDHVAEHYLSLSIRELIADVLHHYEINVWPQVATIATLTATDTATPRIVVEGSALWPSLVATLDIPGVAAAWLTASNAVFEQRILASSQYRTKSPRGKMMVDKFLKRTIVYNQKMMDQVRRYGLASIDVDGASVCELSQRCLSLLGLERYCL